MAGRWMGSACCVVDDGSSLCAPWSGSASFFVNNDFIEIPTGLHTQDMEI